MNAEQKQKAEDIRYVDEKLRSMAEGMRIETAYIMEMMAAAYRNGMYTGRDLERAQLEKRVS